MMLVEVGVDRYVASYLHLQRCHQIRPYAFGGLIPTFPSIRGSHIGERLVVHCELLPLSKELGSGTNRVRLAKHRGC